MAGLDRRRLPKEDLRPGTLTQEPDGASLGWLPSRIGEPRLRLAAAIVVGCFALLLAAPDPAAAAFPGTNGRIAFVSDRDPLGTGNAQVFVMGANGENPTNLSTNPENEEGPAFSPDGTLIAYVSERDFEIDPFPGEDIYVMRADGTEKRRLTRDEVEESQPTFSPDGTSLAFTSFKNGSFGEEIHLINVDGSGESTLLAPSGGVFVSYSDPAWSPDGTRIAFTRSDDSGTNVWVIDLLTGIQTQLTEGALGGQEPDFSPDGSRIVYAAGPPTEPEALDIWSMSADGSDKTRLTASAFEDAEPAFSPEGNQIAFTRRRAQGESQAIYYYPGDVYVMNADGSAKHSLTAGVFTGYLLDEPSSDEQPSWQPLPAGASAVPPEYRGQIAVPPVVRLAARSREATASQTHRTRIRFRLSRRASAKLAIERVRRGRKVGRGARRHCEPAKRKVAKRRRCAVAKLKGWLVRRGRRGRNAVAFNGRLGHRALPAGRYRIRAGAVDRRASPARHKHSRVFRIVSRRRR